VRLPERDGIFGTDRSLTVYEHLERTEKALARRGATAAKEKANVLRAVRHQIAAMSALLRAKGAPPKPSRTPRTKEILAEAARRRRGEASRAGR